MRQKIKQALRWSERYTRTDMVYLARGGFWVGLGQGIASLSGLILAVALANLLSPETFGTYKFVLALSAIIALPTLGGLNTALIRAIAQGYEGTTRATLHRKTLWGAVACLFGLSIAVYYFLTGNPTLAGAALIAAAFIPFMEIGGLWDAVLAGKKEFHRAAAYNAWLYGGVTLALCLTAYINGNLLLVLLAYFGSWTLGRLVALTLVTRAYPDAKHGVSREALTLGGHLSVLGILSTTAVHIDQLLLFHLLGPVTLAHYALALAPIGHLTGFVQILKPLIIAKVPSTTQAMTRAAYLRKLLLLLAALCALALGYTLAAPALFAVLFPQYADAVFYTQILSVGLVGSAATFNTSIFIAHNAQRRLSAYFIITGVVQVLCTALGVYIFGLIGAVLAFVATKLFAALLSTAQALSLLATATEKQNGD